MKNQLISYLEQNLNSFRKSERILADWVLQNPQKTTKLTIKGLSQLTGVSEPSIVRFCRRVATKGYADFKLKLMENLASGQMNTKLDFDDGIACGALRNHVVDITKNALTECALELSDEAIEYAIYQMVKAKQLIIAGFGPFEYQAKNLYRQLWPHLKSVAIINDTQALNQMTQTVNPEAWCLLMDDGSVAAEEFGIYIKAAKSKLFLLSSTSRSLASKADMAWCFDTSDDPLTSDIHLQSKIMAAIAVLSRGLHFEIEGKLQKRLSKQKVKPSALVQSELW